MSTPPYSSGFHVSLQSYQYCSIQRLVVITCFRKFQNRSTECNLYLCNQIPTTSMSCESLSLNFTVTGSVTLMTGLTSLLQLERRSSKSLFASGFPLLKTEKEKSQYQVKRACNSENNINTQKLFYHKLVLLHYQRKCDKMVPGLCYFQEV